MFAVDQEDRHNVGVVQLGGGMGLVAKTLQLTCVEGGREGQQFQRYLPAQGQLFGLVNDAHAAPTQFVQDAEIAEALQAENWAVRVREPGGRYDRPTPRRQAAQRRLTK